jgi:hypothetical protein
MSPGGCSCEVSKRHASPIFFEALSDACIRVAQASAVNRPPDSKAMGVTFKQYQKICILLYTNPQKFGGILCSIFFFVCVVIYYIYKQICYFHGWDLSSSQDYVSIAKTLGLGIGLLQGAESCDMAVGQQQTAEISWGYLQIIHFWLGFSIIKHPFWGTLIYGNPMKPPYQG